MSIDLKRAVDDWQYRESVVGLDDPLITFLKRAGVYDYDDYEWEAGSNWNGPSLAAEPGAMKRAAIRPDPTLTFDELRPLLDLGPQARVVIAKHPSTPLEHLRVLAEDEEVEVQRAVFASPRWSDELLALFAYSKHRWVRTMAAGHPRLPATLVELLLTDPDDDVRSCAARRPEHDAATLSRILQRDPARAGEIAGHPNVTPELLIAAARTGNPKTHEPIAWNKTAPTEALELIAAQSSDRRVNYALSTNPGSSQKILVSLVKHPDRMVREGVAGRTDLPEPLLEALARDYESVVSNAAKRTLERLHHAATGPAKPK